MKRLRLLAAVAFTALSLGGCGGGSGATNAGTDTGTGTVISGMATKGPITGTVNIYAVSSGGKGSLLKSVPVNNGSYSANIGSYVGAVLIEATGSYTDEATGETRTIASTAPLRAALPGASGPVTVAVTPLTELAVQKSGALTEAEITAGNKLISGIFNFDIIGTAPVAPTAAAVASATQSQKDYTLAIAALSQLCSTLGKPLDETLADVAGGIGAAGMNSQTLSTFQSAAATFIIVNTHNTTGVHDLSETSLAAMTGKIPTTASYTLALEGVSAASAVKGIQFELVIPDGLTVRYNASTGATLPGIVTTSQAVAATQPYLVTTFATSTGVSLLSLGLMTGTGIGSGPLATVTCDVMPGYAPPSPSAFSVRNIKAADASGATINGVSVTVY